MDCENPPPAPPAGVLADLCARRAWDEDTDDASRQLLEWAADTIRAILIANARYANRAEHADAKAETYAALMLKAGIMPPSRYGGGR